MRAAVVGHVEWVEFARVEHVPAAGDIVETDSSWETPAGGGAVAAAQLAKLAGEVPLFTALADDALGRRSAEELRAHAVEVQAASRRGRQPRALTLLDADHERTIIVLGGKLTPKGEDPLPWDRLEDADAVYFVSGDADALRAARQARRLVATARELPTLAEAGVRLDALVGSEEDAGERYQEGALEPPPRLVVTTAGEAGGRYRAEDGASGTYSAAPVPGPCFDPYGCGDSFAAGLTFALGSGYELGEALALAARCGAACLTGRGPYEGQVVLKGESKEP